jgi:mRNA interferase RelE/StbE
MNPSWSVRYEDAALKSLARLPANWRSRIKARIDQVAADPRAHHAQVKPLVGRAGLFRLRVGDWRVIYALQDRSLVVLVLAIAPRGNAYD